MAPKVARYVGVGMVEDYLTGELLTTAEASNQSYHVCMSASACECILRDVGYIHFSDTPDDDGLSAAERYYEGYNTNHGSEVDYYPWKALDRQNPGGLGG